MGDSIIRVADIQGAAVPLTSLGVSFSATLLAVSQAHIRAVMQVESAGHGFAAGRPLILYEPHVFSRLTHGAWDRTYPTISYRRWGTLSYPVTQTARYLQLEQAMALNVDAALQSCSWGLMQLLGSNFAACGFASVQAMVRGMCVSEDQQLIAAARFIKANPAMARALMSGDWPTFARLYNGGGQVEQYAGRLKTAFAQHSTANVGQA